MVSAFIVEAQTFLLIHNCAAILVASSSLRNVTAPRYLARASSLRGARSLSEMKWSTFNPDRVNRFLQLILASPTVIFSIGITLPILSDDRCLLVLATTIASTNYSVYIKDVELRKCMLLTDEVSDALVQLVQLEYLDISYTKICSVGKFGALRWLGELVAEGVVGLTPETCQGLENAPSLKTLNLGNTMNGGFSSYDFLLAPGRWKQLKTLKIKGQRKQFFGISGLENLIELDISGLGSSEYSWRYWSDEEEFPGPDGLALEDKPQNVIKPLTGMINLRTVILQSANVIGFKFLLPVKETLLKLDLAFGDSIRRLGAIGELFYLNTLILERCRNLTNDGLKDIAGCVSLESLDISSCCLLTDINVLAELESLRHLRMQDSYVTDAGTQRLEALVQLEVLEMKNSHRLTTISHFVPKLPQLRHLDLANCDMFEAEEMFQNVLLRKSFVDSIEYLDLSETNVFAQYFDAWAEQSSVAKDLLEKGKNGSLKLFLTRKHNFFVNEEGKGESTQFKGADLDFMDLLS